MQRYDTMRLVTALSAIAVLLIGIASASAAEPQGRLVKYGPNLGYSGYFVRPDGVGPFPGLVVIHEWWGLNDEVKAEADRFARQGYVVLAVDLFGAVATRPEDAMRQSRALIQAEATAKMLSAADYLRALPFVAAERVGSLGWCFGGRQSLFFAINDPRLAAAVIYYGQPVTDVKELKKINAAVLGIFGATDESIPVDRVQEFTRALKSAGVRNEVRTYPGVGHAFAGPTRGTRYNAESATAANKQADAFLAKYLKTL